MPEQDSTPPRHRSSRARSVSPTPGKVYVKGSVPMTTVFAGLMALLGALGLVGGGTGLVTSQSTEDRIEKLEVKMEGAHEKQAVKLTDLRAAVEALRRHDAAVDSRTAERENSITRELGRISMRLERIEERLPGRR